MEVFINGMPDYDLDLAAFKLNKISEVELPNNHDGDCEKSAAKII